MFFISKNYPKSLDYEIFLFEMGREVMIDRNKICYHLTENISNLKVNRPKDGGKEESRGEIKEGKDIEKKVNGPFLKLKWWPRHRNNTSVLQ